jgi:hypothetical protein
VKFCVAFGATPFEAVNVIEYVSPVFAAGVPLSRPVPALKVTPLGRVPLSFRVGAGKPVSVTVNAPVVPRVKVVLLALVMAGAWLTVRTKFCVAFGKMPFEAVIVMGYVPPVPALGVPPSTPAGVNVTPLGRVPLSVNVGVGKPVAVTVNDPAVPALSVVLFALVIAGAWSTVIAKVPLLDFHCVLPDPPPA